MVLYLYLVVAVVAVAALFRDAYTRTKATTPEARDQVARDEPTN